MLDKQVNLLKYFLMFCVVCMLFYVYEMFHSWVYKNYKNKNISSMQYSILFIMQMLFMLLIQFSILYMMREFKQTKDDENNNP